MNKRLILSIILVILWMGLIYYMSSMNSDESNSASTSIVVDIIDFFDHITGASKDTINYHHSTNFISHVNHVVRKLAHGLIYFGLAILVFNLLIHLFRKKLIIYDIFTLIICFLYACSDEYHQTFVIGRGGMISDVLIDTLGAIIGCLFINIVYKIAKNRKKSKKI